MRTNVTVWRWKRNHGRSSDLILFVFIFPHQGLHVWVRASGGFEVRRNTSISMSENWEQI